MNVTYKDEVKYLRDSNSMERPISAKRDDKDWSEAYWMVIRNMFGYGLGMFGLGMLTVWLVAGAGLLVLAILIWVAAILGVVAYPLMHAIHKMRN